MAVNRIRGAFAVPRKGETFELRAGLVLESHNLSGKILADNRLTGLNMLTNGRHKLA